MEKARCLHEITRRYTYSTVPNVSTTRVVHPAEWYISPALIDNAATKKYSSNAATKKYSSIVVLRLEPDSDMADLEHICEFIESNVHVWVRVKLLNDSAFLLYTVLIRIILYATV